MCRRAARIPLPYCSDRPEDSAVQDRTKMSWRRGAGSDGTLWFEALPDPARVTTTMVKHKITEEYAKNVARLECTFPQAHQFLVRLEREGAGHGLRLSTAVNAHLYKYDGFLAYLRPKCPEALPPSLVISPRFHLRIDADATDRSGLLFPVLVNRVLNTTRAPHDHWAKRRPEGAIELTSSAPEEFFTTLYEALVALSTPEPT